MIKLLKKIIDKDGKVFGKINIIDLSIIFIFVVLIFGSVFRFKSNIFSKNNDVKLIYYHVKIRDVKKSSIKFYKPGLKVYDSNTKNYLGVIKGVIYYDYYDYITDIDGIIHRAQKPDKIEIDLGIKVNGLETDQAYLADGTYELKAGSDIYILTKYADVIGKIESVSLLDNLKSKS